VKLLLRIRNAIRYIGESDLFQFYGENESNGNFQSYREIGSTHEFEVSGTYKCEKMA